MPIELLPWLREQCAAYEFDVSALYRRHGDHGWPLTATDEHDLEWKLDQGAHFLPLPKEPAALANVIEVSVVDHLIERVEGTPGIGVSRGTERGYPDLEFQFGDAFYAVDVKVARRNTRGTKTQSRIALYTGNTYFRYPSFRWPGTFRSFEDYVGHLDIICLYTLNTNSYSRAEALELLVQESWRIGSKQRPSTTREYIGAVTDIEALRKGQGEFESADAFYGYWRRYNFRVGKVVQQQLDRLLAEQRGEKP